MTIRKDRAERLDVWEHRSTQPFGVDVRAADDTITLTGYASTFEPYDMYGGPATGGWVEQLDKRAFDETLSEKPDLHLLINHEGMPLARTKSGTLDLSVDDRGLKVVARLDRSDPDVQRLEPKMRRGDMDEMSFAFRVKGQKWDSAPGFEEDKYSLRTITKVSLHKGDVSVVNFGANPTTHAEVKSVDELLAELAALDCAAVEMRASDDLIAKAHQKLVELRGKPTPSRVGGMSLREALARQGLAAADGSTMSLDEALKLSDQ